MQITQVPCYLTRTNAATHQIVLDNQHLNRHVLEEITGPRLLHMYIFLFLVSNCCMYMYVRLMMALLVRDNYPIQCIKALRNHGNIFCK